jgi:hypothetical protein
MRYFASLDPVHFYNQKKYSVEQMPSKDGEEFLFDSTEYTLKLNDRFDVEIRKSKSTQIQILHLTNILNLTHSFPIFSNNAINSFSSFNTNKPQSEGSNGTDCKNRLF